MTTIKQELMALGMEEYHFDHTDADLQFISNTISDLWIENFPKKALVDTFEYKGDKWYEIKDGYLAEYTFSQEPFNKVTFEKVSNPSLKQEMSDEEYKKIDSYLYKLFQSDNFAYTSTSSYAAFWCNENPKGSGNHRFITKELSVLRAITVDTTGNIIAVYENAEGEDTFYLVNAE